MNKIREIIYGYVVGDCYGLGLLNNEKSDDTISFIDNTNKNIDKGNYSFMTVFMLATLDSIIKNKDVNAVDILNKMCTSLIVGKYTSDGNVYCLDNNTLNILKYYCKKNNLNCFFDEDDCSGYSLCRILPLILFNYSREDDLDKLVNLVSLTNINETVLLGSYIYYKFIYNMLDGYDKYKALSKISIPSGFSKDVINKYKFILKGNLFYKEIVKDDKIINILSIVFYVVLNSNSFDDILMMLKNIDGNVNIYSSLICTIGAIEYGIPPTVKNLVRNIKNKKEINKYIKSFERLIKL